MIEKIQHIGIAVADLEKAVSFYRDVLGLQFAGYEEVPDQKVKTAIFRVGETKIELLASTSPDGPIGRFIEKRGEGIHHICFAVGDIEEAIRRTKEKGGRMIDEEPRQGVEGTKVAFVHPRSAFGVLVEYAQEGGKEE
ncbi:MAG: methylmalonyl-CoA epimerase [Deltaproteobacteria bacterium]|nr:MAG: methylmalonyl-CoA epimerase [Deltaproteobacteria bacterium]